MTVNSLNLLDPFRTTIEYERFVFPDGQDHIKITSPISQAPVTIITPIKNASDLFVLLQATEVLRNHGVKEIRLVITYLLSARMDRRMSPGEPITLKIVAQLINLQNYDFVRVYDPHSEVSLTLINRSETIPTTGFIDSVLAHIDEAPLLIAPDAGASLKTEKLAHIFNLDVIYCTKSRSKETGYISKVKVNAENLNGRNCLIVDDICDGGATFIGLGKELKKHNAGNLYLAVSHGIFSKGFDQLSDYEKIFTTNSYIKNLRHDKLTIYHVW